MFFDIRAGRGPAGRGVRGEGKPSPGGVLTPTEGSTDLAHHLQGQTREFTKKICKIRHFEALRVPRGAHMAKSTYFTTLLA